MSFSYIAQHHGQVYLISSAMLSFLALPPTPSFWPVVALLTILQLSTATFLPRHEGVTYTMSQIVLISFAIAAAHVAPSMQALSTPVLSLIVLTNMSLVTSLVAFTALSVNFYWVRNNVHTPWTRITCFPAIWASAWGIAAYFNPVGRLTTWSPVTGLGPYAWIRPVFGQWGIDWVTAAWAVIGAEIIGMLYVGEPPDDVEHIRVHQPSQSRPILSLSVLLLALAAPSTFQPYVPLPVVSSDITPFRVACALPFPHHAGHRTHVPNLEDYIKETKTLQASANVVLWPESAVRFDTAADRVQAFEKIQWDLNNGKYVGVSFEDFVPEDEPNGGRAGMRRNGFVLLGKKGPVLEYYKRALVPIAESFSIVRASDPPPIFNLQLGVNKNSGYTKPEWAPAPNYTRPIPLTASICLDFSSSSSFGMLPTRPALVLAPARTWHIDVGLAMWEQAKARAEELGSMVLWCDGGDGGVSGVAGGGMSEYYQVGPGSWTKTIGLQWPFDERRTVFAAGGDFLAFLAAWGVLVAGWMVESGYMAISAESSASFRQFFAARFGALGDTIRRWRGVRREEEQSLLD